MKQKIMIIFFLLCIVLSGCSEESSSDTTTNEPNSTISDTPTTSPTAEPTEAIAPTSAPDVSYDYSSHTAENESEYKTQLADIARVSEGKPVFALSELSADYSWVTFEGFQNKNDVFGYDVRYCDITGEDLSVVDDFNDLTFSTDTVWPDKLPEGFDPSQILEYNKNPGLGIRALHDQGITGDGVSIAIIDQGLLLDHEQYKDNIMYYEKIHCSDSTSSMHGPAVASIAVGKDIGVAPGAKLYFIAITSGHFSEYNYEFDASITADAIYRVLEINKYLPDSEKIRVISISKGYSGMDIGYKEMKEAIKTADEQGVFVLTTSTEDYYKGFGLFGMDRDYLDDPDDINSYKPVYWIESDFYSNPDRFQNYIMAPIGSRTFADASATDYYAISSNGGLSWSVPWYAGLYALCCQVKPNITPQEFIDIVKTTADTTKIEHAGKTYDFGKIINPVKIIEKLQN